MSPFRPPLLLSLCGGYVDAAGYLALHGLFTTHVTGNFVTFGASMTHGVSGGLAKLMALPVFCVMVIGTQVLGDVLERRALPAFRILVSIKVVLLALGAALAIHYGPFVDGDALPALVTGMVLVAAMAMQNATHRRHLASEPPSTVMTMTTTQIMLDVATLIQHRTGPKREAADRRIRRMSPSLIAFALGCLLAAGLFLALGMWLFVLPPCLALLAMQGEPAPLDA
ncbi:DUF1275 domain-containing protein [Ancylobacter sp. 6x-1]|uniref:DUF1275 domain-containing protein n=1 Tax=Ancylobacter crimeensis TaxID=2579147 RepID=A0ABT0D6X6_9HYPH|nr:YoaK family protein [Ancylobacter crimeensis]MCK0195703.1 DUF1275 domain-containing protein [Ancylobacter crimeensis]